jgi:hypothetical protein
MGENGKWQLAFWVVTVICGVWLGTLSTNVIANDRIRSDEDGKILDKLEVLLKDNIYAHMAIIGDLREIKVRMGIQDGKLN